MSLRLGLSLLLALFLVRSAAAQTIAIVDATEKVYQNDTALPGAAASATIYAAQNEFEAFQIVVGGPATAVSVTANALTGPGGFQLVPSLPGRQGDILVYREAFISLPSSGSVATDPAAKEGNAPDALIPQVDEFYQEARNASVASLAAGQNAVWFVDLHVPQQAPAGVYSGSVSVRFNGTSSDVPVTLTVWPFALPSTPRLKTYVPFPWDGAATQYPSLVGQCCNDTVAQMHLLHAMLGVNHRVTIHAFDYGSGDLTAYANNFGALIDGNASTLLAGAHPTVLNYLGPHGASNTLGTWRSFFSQKGWLGYLVDYVADEPANGVNSNWCTLIANAASDAAAGVRSLTTASIEQAQGGTCSVSSSPLYGQKVDLAAINVFTPVVDQVQPSSMGTGQSTMGDYAAWRSGSRNGIGNEVWEYQSCDSWDCGSPGTALGWPSYAIDHSAIRSRALEWISFRNGISGELYWQSAIAWVALTKSPWTNQYWSGGNGDGTLVYPGVAANAQVGGSHDVPLASLRLKMLREGVEDYEYMSILADLGDGDYARSKVDGVFPTASSVTGASPQALYSARHDMACRIITDQHPWWTCDPASWTTTCTKSDCFARPDSATLGGNWNTYSGALQITGARATNSVANTNNVSVWLSAIGPDQDVAVDCKVAGAGNNCGLIARWSDANDHYYAYLDAGLGAIDLWRMQGGALTKLGTASRAIAAGSWYHLRLVVQGSSLAVYFDGEATPAISATDTSLTAGSYGGLHAFAGGAQAIWYGSFDIKAPPAPPSDFSIAVAPQTLSVVQGLSASYTVSTTVTSGAAQTVALSVTGLPASASASFNPPSVAAGSSSAMTISTGLSTPAGTWGLTVVGAGTTSKTAAATMAVQPGISFRAKSTFTAAAGTTRTLALAVPAPVQANDALIATIFIGEYATHRTAAAISAPPGWTLLRQVNNSMGLLQIYSRVATAADAGALYTWTTNIRVGAACSVLAYSGASAVDAVSGQTDTWAATTYPSPSVTTRAAADLVIPIYAGAGQSAAGSWSAPAGTTQRLSISDGSLLSLSTDDAIQVAAGSSLAFNSTATQPQRWALTATAALKR